MMRGCKDQRFAEMLEMYVMDLLNESEREEFELHLLRCAECSAAVEAYHEISMLILRSPQARDALKELAGEGGRAEGEAPAPIDREGRRKWAPRLAVAFSIAAVVLLLILKPWHIEIAPDKTALAQDDRLAVMPFENPAADDSLPLLGRAASNLLIADLSEGKHIQVISDQQYQDIMKILGDEDTAHQVPTLASRIAQRAGARWLLMGAIREYKPRMVLDVVLVNSLDGDTVLQKQISGGPGDDIFVMIDRLSAAISTSLAAPSEDSLAPDRSVADITTHSLAAYLNYIEGVENYHRFYVADAKRNFTEAVSHDSAFAMAYYYLSLIDDPGVIALALKYQDRASRKDRYYIRSQAALNRHDTTSFVGELKGLMHEYPDEKVAQLSMGTYLFHAGNYAEAKQYLSNALRLDSLYTLAYNMLAYLYDRTGDFDSALWAINRYVFISPREANPYDTRGDICADYGQIELAIESYKMAIQIRPDFMYTAVKLGNMYHLKREYAEAEKWYTRRLAGGNLFDSLSTAVELGNILMSQGRMADAVDLLDRSLKRAEMHPSTDLKTITRILRIRKTSALLEVDPQRALTEIAKIVADGSESDPELLQFYVQVLAENSRFDRAQEIIRRLDSISTNNQPALYAARYARACLELKKANFTNAVEYFQKATEQSLPENDFIGNFMLAQACLAAGQTERAIALLDYQQSRYNPQRLQFAAWSAEIDYYLGRAYESRGALADAKEHFLRFLEIWKHADLGLPIVQDAQLRLRRIIS